MKYDVIVVGAGPAGITAAIELSRASLKVALIESGGLEFDAETQALYDGSVTGHKAIDLTSIRLRMFGGTSNHWGGHCTPLDPIDFARKPISGLSGWPISYDDILPFYHRANAHLGFEDFNYTIDLAHQSNREDFLLPDDDRIETVAIRGSGPLNFRNKFFETLNQDPNVDILLNQNVVGFEMSDQARFSGIKTVSLGGEQSLIKARALVLACGAVETARLLLIHNVKNSSRIGDQGGFLGKCYMDHIAGGAAFLHLAKPVGEKPYWRKTLKDKFGRELNFVIRLKDQILESENLSNSHYYLIPFSNNAEIRKRREDANTSINSLKSLVKWTIGRNSEKIVLSEEYCKFITNASSFVSEQWHQQIAGEKADRLLLRYEAEQTPSRDNYVSLTEDLDRLGFPKPALHWSPSIVDRDSIVRTCVYFGRVFGEGGIGRIEIEDHFDQRYWDAGTSWHQLGTTRMANDPSSGVVDENCLVFGTENLFIAGGSVMPSCGRSNPTLTIMALSIRLSDHIRQRFGSI